MTHVAQRVAGVGNRGNRHLRTALLVTTNRAVLSGGKCNKEGERVRR